MLNIFLQKLSKRYRPKAAAVISVQLAVLTVLLVSFWLNSRTSKETILLSKADKRQSSSQLPKALLPIPGWLMEEAFRLDLNSCQSELPSPGSTFSPCWEPPVRGNFPMSKARISTPWRTPSESGLPLKSWLKRFPTGPGTETPMTRSSDP